MNETKHTMLSSLITAIVAGIFTITAGLVTNWVSTKEPALTYSIIER